MVPQPFSISDFNSTRISSFSITTTCLGLGHVPGSVFTQSPSSLARGGFWDAERVRRHFDHRFYPALSLSSNTPSPSSVDLISRPNLQSKRGNYLGAGQQTTDQQHPTTNRQPLIYPQRHRQGGSLQALALPLRAFTATSEPTSSASSKSSPIYSVPTTPRPPPSSLPREAHQLSPRYRPLLQAPPAIPRLPLYRLPPAEARTENIPCRCSRRPLLRRPSRPPPVIGTLRAIQSTFWKCEGQARRFSEDVPRHARLGQRRRCRWRRSW